MTPKEKITVYYRAAGGVKGSGFTTEVLAMLKDPLIRHQWNGTWQVGQIITRNYDGGDEENVQTNYWFYPNTLGRLFFWTTPHKQARRLGSNG